MSRTALAEIEDGLPATFHAASAERTPIEPRGASQVRPPGVLVIEDHDRTRRNLERGLKTYGLSVWAAAGGGDAIELYRANWHQIDVVLSDLNMPEMDGPQTVDLLQEINPVVRFCFMTADARESTTDRLLKSGAIKVFTKPFSSLADVAADLREFTLTPSLRAVDDAIEAGPTETVSDADAYQTWGLAWMASLFKRISE